MALSTQPYKGARDFYPEEKRVQKYMFGKMRQVVESFGYEEYDAPVMEPVELYLAKTGEEIVNEQTYAFEDRGGRKVALRPEMTPTVSRLVAAKRKELGYPLRLFNIGPRWRYERQQRGRYREFFQLDADLFGVSDAKADFEIIQVADAIMNAFKAERSMYTIKLNSRKFMDHVLSNYLGFDAVQSASVAKLIDRMRKISNDEFILQVDALCTPSQREIGTVEKLLVLLQAKDVKSLPDELGNHETLVGLKELLDMLSSASITNAEFDVTLMRGFDYYTDIVFEVFDNHPDNNRAMYGGGRYDGLVGLFGVEPVATVGFAMGDATLANFLESHQLLPVLKPETQVYAVLIGDVFDQAQRVIKRLRDEGVFVAVDITGRDIGKQFRAADKKGITYALVIGQQELDSDQFNLKNLKTGEEQARSIERITTILQDQRQES